MEIKEALKALATAVGDGKLVPQHAYVFFDGSTLRVCNGKLWAGATIDSIHPAFVRHASLAAAFERDNALLQPGIEAHSVLVQAGRSRVKLKGISPLTFPTEPVDPPRWLSPAPEGFKDTLAALSKFCGSQDNHIWQMGVHFMEQIAFAANPFALIVKTGNWFPSPITIPPWAAEFILAQDESPNLIGDTQRHLKFLWSHRLGLTTTMLIEEPAENIVTYAHGIANNTMGGQPVPDNLREAVTRVAALGATRVRIGSGVIDHLTEELEFDEEVDIDCAPRTWGVKQLLDALEHAETINLQDSPALWEGNGYKGVFSGLSG